jgi:hypothetical protein
MKKILTCLAVLVVLALSAATHAGPISKYYVTTGSQRTIHVIQGSSVVNSWSTQSYEYPIAVLDGLVRTTAPRDDGNTGSEYTTDGAFTGTIYSRPGAIGTFWDSTTDGTYNYGYDFADGGMYRMDLDWQNPTLLFAGPAEGHLGVTYDPTNTSLWVADWEGQAIMNCDMAGNTLSSFDTGVTKMAGLALDHADGTLWFGTKRDLEEGTRTLYQYSKTGDLLSTDTYALLADQNYLGGEFEFIPEPSSFILAFMGLLGLLSFVRSPRK